LNGGTPLNTKKGTLRRNTEVSTHLGHYVLGASQISTPCYATLLRLQGPLFKAIALKQRNGTKSGGGG